MRDAILHKMVIQNHKESELADLEMDPKSEDMLAEIECLQKHTEGKI